MVVIVPFLLLILLSPHGIALFLLLSARRQILFGHSACWRYCVPLQQQYYLPNYHRRWSVSPPERGFDILLPEPLFPSSSPASSYASHKPRIENRKNRFVGTAGNICISYCNSFCFYRRKRVVGLSGK